jgi:hypothetical protein
MPEWIHNREQHIRAKNPGMPESEAWAIATQQAHATGKSPKGYGTPEGRREAHEKYTTPGDDKKTADPGGVGKKLEKDASIFRAIAPAITQDQDDRMRQIIREELQASQLRPHHKQPSIKAKVASVLGAPFSLVLVEGFSDELQRIKIAQLTMNSAAPKPTVSSQLTSRLPRNTLSPKTPSYSQMNPASTPGPSQMTQPTLSPPPVNG